MVEQTKTAERLAALNAVLAEATKACPELHPWDGPPPYDRSKPHSLDCKGICQGTGEVARFPEFRQVCERCHGDGWLNEDDISISQEFRDKHPDWYKGCWGCGGFGQEKRGRRWLVRAGHLEDALAGLTKGQASLVHSNLNPVSWSMGWEAEPMSDPDTILVEALEMVCLVAKLIRPCLRHGGTDWAGGPTCLECEALGGYVVIEVTGLEVPDA